MFTIAFGFWYGFWMSINFGLDLSPHHCFHTPCRNSEEQNVDLTLSDDLERIVIKKVQAKYNKITMNTIRDATINCPDLQFTVG